MGSNGTTLEPSHATQKDFQQCSARQLDLTQSMSFCPPFSENSENRGPTKNAEQLNHVMMLQLTLTSARSSSDSEDDRQVRVNRSNEDGAQITRRVVGLQKARLESEWSMILNEMVNDMHNDG